MRVMKGDRSSVYRPEVIAIYLGRRNFWPVAAKTVVRTKFGISNR